MPQRSCSLYGHDAQQHRQTVEAQQRVDEQHAGTCPQHSARDHQQAAAIHGVGDSPAPQAKDDQRHEADGTEHSDPERRAGQLVHLHWYGDCGQLEPDERHRVSDPEPPKVDMTQRRDIDSGSSQQRTTAATHAREGTN